MKAQAKDIAPESEEQKFKQKCKELKRRINEIEESNEIATLALTRTQSTIRRLRLEYIILLERLEDRANALPEGIVGFEEMACPPAPGILDESWKAKNGASSGTNATSIKRGSGGGGGGGGGASKKKPSSGANTTETGAGGSGSDEKKQPKVRDPDLPKRPTNAYLLFCEQEKERIKHQNEEAGVTSDLSRSMTDAWKHLNDEERKPYYKLYEDDKLRYQREMEVYNQKKEQEQEQEQEEDEESKPAVKRLKLEVSGETPESTPDASLEIPIVSSVAHTPTVDTETEPEDTQQPPDVKEEETPQIEVNSVEPPSSQIKSEQDESMMITE
ncbi:NHP10 [[Candida] subhashii]|uniref:NHP10 n=1 Tax=[Candida] subhashii TaxID=561895 RepID=A0A8J5QK63_9ASCO|nr:NHP10 [[Candida] subhashii]KAG7664572.1 NHP10 [[Candida] subhashii]